MAVEEQGHGQPASEQMVELAGTGGATDGATDLAATDLAATQCARSGAGLKRRRKQATEEMEAYAAVHTSVIEEALSDAVTALCNHEEQSPDPLRFLAAFLAIRLLPGEGKEVLAHLEELL